MSKIKGFTTKDSKEKNLDKLAKSGASFILPFEVTQELDVEKNPFSKSKINLKDKSGKEQKIVIKTKQELSLKYNKN